MRDYLLLVEDDPLDLSFTERALRLCSIQIEIRIARDGAAVLEMLARADDARPVLVLLDLKLPKVDGFEVLKHIRRTPGLDHIPVIIVSGSIFDADRVRATLLGANNYVAKAQAFRDFAQLLALALLPYSGMLDVGGRTAPPARRAGDRPQ